MDNNKNHIKTHKKSNSELRKMFPHDGPNSEMENIENKLNTKNNKR